MNRIFFSVAEKEMNEGKTGPRKIIVPMPLSLLSCLDAYAIQMGQPRTAVVREAVRLFLGGLPDGEGFRKPEDGVEITEPTAHKLEGYEE